jgi:hypothetical protein
MINNYTGRFITFSVVTNIYNRKTKGLTLMELFTATGKLNKLFFFFFLTTRDFRCLHYVYACRKNLNIVSMCAVSPVVHASNISSCQKKEKKLFQFSCGFEQFH